MIRIEVTPGSGGAFDQVRWRCSGQGVGCGVWYAAQRHWAPVLAAKHAATVHPGAAVTRKGWSPPGNDLLRQVTAEAFR